MAVYRGYIRTVPGGAPVPNGTVVELRRTLDNTLIASLETTNGEWEYTTFGTIPPYEVRAITDVEVRYSFSKTTGMTGATTLSLMPYMFRAWSNGVIRDIFSNMAVTTGGANMNVFVDSGAAHARGIIYDQDSMRTLVATAADASNPRIDTVIIEVVPAGAGEDIEGQSSLKILPGSPSPTPVAPSLTQSSTLYQMALADVRVDAGVTALNSDKVTDRRTYASPIIGPNEITSVHIKDGDILPVDFHADVLEWLRDNVADFLKAGTNITLTHDDAANTLTIASTGGGSGTPSPSVHLYKDTNFAASGHLSNSSGSPRQLGTTSISVPAGTWRLDVFTTFTARGAGSAGSTGTFRVLLDGNGTAQGADQSSRQFQTMGGYPRQIILSSRRVVTPTTTTTYTANAKVHHESGTVSDIRDGVVWIQAT